jgi:hypothetical protein
VGTTWDKNISPNNVVLTPVVRLLNILRVTLEEGNILFSLCFNFTKDAFTASASETPALDGREKFRFQAFVLLSHGQ